MGVLIPVARLDNWLAALDAGAGRHQPGTAAHRRHRRRCIYAYLVRFLAVALQTVEAEPRARSRRAWTTRRAASGYGPGATLRARARAAAARQPARRRRLLVFVDVMKELPATLVMRPFNFDTLATQTFTLASDERLAGGLHRGAGDRRRRSAAADRAVAPDRPQPAVVPAHRAKKPRRCGAPWEAEA
ncbi:MAG: hypothetical protein MZW92_70475 [Comamonadaceae bacterium]|nr:hypothetical protein [Comamonadaceae bacterium]